MATNTHSRRNARQAAPEQKQGADASLVSLDGQAPGKPVKTRSAPARTAEPRTRAAASRQGEQTDSGPLGADAEDNGARNEDSHTITRRSRQQRSVDTFAIPDEWKKRGWDYQFWVSTVLGQPVEATTEIYEGGWRPVLWKDVPKPWTPNAKGTDQIMRGGQALYTRPMELTQEAKREEYNAAEQQKRDRVQSALEGKVSGQEGISDIKGVVVRNQSVTVEGEVGVHGGHK